MDPRAFSSAAIAAAATVRECWRSTPVSRRPEFRLPATPIPGRSAVTKRLRLSRWNKSCAQAGRGGTVCSQ